MMKRVTGLGGIFFKAKDPKALYEWYRLRLGIESNPDGSGANWRDADHPEIPGCCVWGIFPQDTTYFGSGQLSFMVNFRVENLDELLRLLREEGVPVDPKVEKYDYGKLPGLPTRKVIVFSCGDHRKETSESDGQGPSLLADDNTTLDRWHFAVSYNLQRAKEMIFDFAPRWSGISPFPCHAPGMAVFELRYPAMTGPRVAKPVTEEPRQRKTRAGVAEADSLGYSTAP